MNRRGFLLNLLPGALVGALPIAESEPTENEGRFVFGFSGRSSVDADEIKRIIEREGCSTQHQMMSYPMPTEIKLWRNK